MDRRQVSRHAVLDAALDVVDMHVEEAREDERPSEGLAGGLDRRDEPALEAHDAGARAVERVDEEAATLVRHARILPAPCDAG
jgi:hypothetical protein